MAIETNALIKEGYADQKPEIQAEIGRFPGKTRTGPPLFLVKKRVLAMPDGNFLAHTSRALELAKQLRQIGYEVIFASEGKYTKLIRDENFPVVPIVTSDPDEVLGCIQRGRMNWCDMDLMDQLVQEELSLFRELKPDLVLADFRISLRTSCELAGIPLAALINAGWTNYYSCEMEAPETFPVTRVLGKWITTRLIPVIKPFLLFYDTRDIRRYRKWLGLDGGGNLFDMMAGDLNLMVDIPEYGPTEDLPENFHYIGPIVWEPSSRDHSWIEDIQTDKKVIYFTLGSTGDHKFYQTVIDIFGDTEFEVIMTSAGLFSPSEVPENFTIVDFAPGSKILEKSDLIICQGGNGTIYQAMTQGVPIIGIPMMLEQEHNLDRVMDLGVGIKLSGLKFCSEHLLSAVNEILTDDTYKTNSTNYRNILRRYSAPRRGAELIHHYLS